MPDVQRWVKETVAHFWFLLTVLSDTDVYSFIAKALCKGSEVSFLSGCAGCWVQSWRFSEHVLSARFSGSSGLLSCSLCLCHQGSWEFRWALHLLSCCYWLIASVPDAELISGDGRCWDAALSYYFKCPALLTAGASHTSNPLDHFSVCIVLKVLAGLGEAKSLTFSLRAGIWFPVSLALSDLWKGFITV